jgi:hypothetical protein
MLEKESFLAGIFEGKNTGTPSRMSTPAETVIERAIAGDACHDEVDT